MNWPDSTRAVVSSSDALRDCGEDGADSSRIGGTQSPEVGMALGCMPQENRA